MALELKSSAFGPDQMIPRKYTCEGEDVSPALLWEGAPAGTKSFALICDDPDAPMGTWVHWVLYDLPADAKGLEEGVAKSEKLQSGAKQGKTNFGSVGYGGPCPPPGHGTHHYHFKLYALDAALDLQPGAAKNKLLQAMKGHILAETELVGLYKR